MLVINGLGMDKEALIIWRGAKGMRVNAVQFDILELFIKRMGAGVSLDTIQDNIQQFRPAFSCDRNAAYQQIYQLRKKLKRIDVGIAALGDGRYAIC